MIETEKTYGQEYDPSTHLLQVSIDDIPRFQTVLRYVSVS